MKLSNILKTTLIASVVTATAAYAADESFESSIRLIEPVTVTEVTSLVFPEQIAGTAQAVTITPDDTGAAQFNSAGEPSRNVTASILETSITMITGTGAAASQQIVVNNFSYGGSVAPDGTGAFELDGTLNGIRIGATANIDADDQSGNYVGTATFRLVYA